jgi:hypothetical protein
MTIDLRRQDGKPVRVSTLAVTVLRAPHHKPSSCVNIADVVKWTKIPRLARVLLSYLTQTSIFAHSSWLPLLYYSLPNAVVAGTLLPMSVLKTLSTQINGTVAVGNERELFRSKLWSNYTPERCRAWAGHWYQGDNWSELSGCGTARYAPARDQQACFKIKFYDAT